MPLKLGRVIDYRHYRYLVKRFYQSPVPVLRRICVLPLALALLLGFLIGYHLSILPSLRRPTRWISTRQRPQGVLTSINFTHLINKKNGTLSNLQSPLHHKNGIPSTLSMKVEDESRARPPELKGLLQQKQTKNWKEKKTEKTRNQTIVAVNEELPSEGKNEVFQGFSTGYTNSPQDYDGNRNNSIMNNNNINNNKGFLVPKEVDSEEGSPDEDFDDEAPFRYLINEAQFCQLRPGLRVLNLVETAPWEFAARSLIRRLWGSPRWFNSTGFATAFVVGTTRDVNVTEQVQIESATFHDLLQVDLVDSYKNLTFKTQTLLHWTAAFCPKATWLLKSDRDVLVNTFNLKRILDKYEEKQRQARVEGIPSKGPQFLCKSKPKNALRPCRHGRACPRKWRVSHKNYPYHKYPNHCCGPAYLIPRELVRKLYRGANKTHPFRLEDVYYTGLLPIALGLNTTIANLSGRFPWRPRSWRKSFTTTDIMIFELDERLGKGTTTRVWQQIVKNFALGHFALDQRR